MINLESLKQTCMVLCSLLNRFYVTLHLNDLEKKNNVLKSLENIRSGITSCSTTQHVFSVRLCTHPSRLELGGFRCGGFDQRNDHRRFNRLLLSLLWTRYPKGCHWINTIPDPRRRGEEGMWKAHDQREDEEEKFDTFKTHVSKKKDRSRTHLKSTTLDSLRCQDSS